MSENQRDFLCFLSIYSILINLILFPLTSEAYENSTMKSFPVTNLHIWVLKKSAINKFGMKCCITKRSNFSNIINGGGAMVMVFNATFNTFSYIVAASFIGGGNHIHVVSTNFIT